MSHHQGDGVVRSPRHRRHHNDEYYSPTSLIGLVRAERVKYLVGFLDERRRAWELTEKIDPSQNTVVEPGHEAEGAQQLLEYYEAVRRDRRLRLVITAGSFLGIGGLSVLVAWLSSNLLFGVAGVAIGMGVSYWIWIGTIAVPATAGAALSAFETSGYFRDRSPLSGYLVTTSDRHVIWKALDLEQCRRSVDDVGTRLRAHVHLSAQRELEITKLQEQERELRQQIVDMLDPRPSAADSLADETRAAVAHRIGLGPIAGYFHPLMTGYSPRQAGKELDG